MTPDQFITKWDANTRNEQAASKEHFLDLCALLDVPTPNSDLPAATYAANPHAQAIATAAAELVARRDAWLNPADLVDRIPEVVPGFPDRIVPKNEAAAAVLRTRTLTNLYNTRGTPAGAWLDSLHARLDAAVAAAYGWPVDISTADALARLLALNHARAAA